MTNEIDDLGAGEAETDAPLRRGRGPESRISGQRLPPRPTDRPGMRAEANERLRRARKRTEDPFHIDPSEIPDEQSWEWKAFDCKGMPLNDNINLHRENHFKNVPTRLCPRLMPEGTDPEAPIVKGGQYLMSRPKYLWEDAHNEDVAIARREVQIKEQALASGPQGTAPRVGTLAGNRAVGHGVEGAIVVPKD
jgi:hypothetical protein